MLIRFLKSPGGDITGSVCVDRKRRIYDLPEEEARKWADGLRAEYVSAPAPSAPAVSLAEPEPEAPAVAPVVPAPAPVVSPPKAWKRKR